MGQFRCLVVTLMAPSPHISKFKVVLLGDAGVGKTSLMMRMTQSDFDPRKEVDPSCDVDEATLRVQSSQGRYLINLFDTAGDEMFRTMTSSYFRNAHAIFLVFDLTRPETLKSICNIWLPDCKNYASNAVYILVGNKSDLTPNIDREEIQQFADDNELVFTCASSFDDAERLLTLKQLLLKQLTLQSPPCEEEDASPLAPLRKSPKSSFSPSTLKKRISRFRRRRRSRTL